jgi:hypothetical protein
VKPFMRKDRDAIARVSRDLAWAADRRGILAVTVDVDDAHRLLRLVDRLRGDVERMEAELSKRSRSETCRTRCQVSGLQR